MLLIESILGTALTIIFNPYFLDLLRSNAHATGIVNLDSFSGTLVVGDTTYYQTSLLFIMIMLGLLLSLASPLRNGIDLFILRYRHKQLAAYQERRHYITLVGTLFLGVGFGSSVLGFVAPEAMLWLYISLYYVGYFSVLVSLMLYSLHSGISSSSSSLSSSWLFPASISIVAIVVLSHLWGTTPFIWTLVLFFHILRLPLRESFYYAILSVIAYYTFYILYGIIFLSHGILGFSLVQVVSTMFIALLLASLLRFMMSSRNIIILSLLCFYLGVGYLLWV